MEGKFDIPKLYDVLAKILSDKYDMDITFTVRLKDEVKEANEAASRETA